MYGPVNDPRLVVGAPVGLVIRSLTGRPVALVGAVRWSSDGQVSRSAGCWPAWHSGQFGRSE